MKKTSIFLFFILVSISCFAQTNQDKARAAYLHASEAYNTQKYNDCIAELKSAIGYLGATNVRIQHLLSKACFQQKNYSQAKIEIKSYFDFNPEVNDDYREILGISKQIDALFLTQKAEQAAQKADDDAWKIASSRGTISAYQNYLAKFPYGKYSRDANDKLDEIAWLEIAKINTVQSYKNYIKDYPNGNHNKQANSKIKEFDDEVNYKKYRDMGDVLFYEKEWDNAVSQYTQALKCKSNDTYLLEKIKTAKINFEKEKNMTDYTNKIAFEEKLRIEYNKFAIGRFVWSGVFAGGAVAFGTLLEEEDQKILFAGLSGLLSVYGLTVGVKNLGKAAKCKSNANEYREKLRMLSFAPVINPIDNYYGCSLVIRLR